LEHCGIIKVKNEGKMRPYSIENDKIRKLLEVLEE